jgi:demethylmenaquinone methyltransferase / 2-methoxy-6-polyprenyl-1,4-benzoquinol methylase
MSLNEKRDPVAGPPADFVKNLFNSISGTYDRANDVMTFGMARAWRRELVKWSNVKEGSSVLDCATGTGDLAIKFKHAVGSGRVVGADFSEGMLSLAPEKAREAGLDIEFKLADVMALPYASQSFDTTSIAYGIRNVSNVRLALTEMARVTKPGGNVMILETGENRMPIVRAAMGLYFKYVVPRLGGMISGRRDAYEYLNKSSQAFPSGEEFCALMYATGCFARVEHRAVMGGASYIYKGTV